MILEVPPSLVFCDAGMHKAEARLGAAETLPASTLIRVF